MQMSCVRALMMKASKSTSSAAANCSLRSGPARRPTGWPPAVPSARPSPNRRARWLARAVSSGPAYELRCAADRGPLSSESDEVDGGREYLFACGCQKEVQENIQHSGMLQKHFWPCLLLRASTNHGGSRCGHPPPPYASCCALPYSMLTSATGLRSPHGPCQNMRMAGRANVGSVRRPSSAAWRQASSSSRHPAANPATAPASC